MICSCSLSLLSDDAAVSRVRDGEVGGAWEQQVPLCTRPLGPERRVAARRTRCRAFAGGPASRPTAGEASRRRTPRATVGMPTRARAAWRRPGSGGHRSAILVLLHQLAAQHSQLGCHSPDRVNVFVLVGSYASRRGRFRGARRWSVTGVRLMPPTAEQEQAVRRPGATRGTVRADPLRTLAGGLYGAGTPAPLTGVGLFLAGTRLRRSGACHAPEGREPVRSPGAPGWKGRHYGRETT